ncbi:MAG: hypothetical protein GKS07_08400 [Nitrosopumilus sp.]|nr:MAG: hypothetical protein GKS07_08400 [Nitrosopumilus sp.]
MAEAVPLSNSKVVLIVVAILALIFLANIIMPSLSEKMICGLQGGQWDTMLRVCGFDPKVCTDAGGTPIQISGKCGVDKQCNAPSAYAIGCEFD